MKQWSKWLTLMLALALLLPCVPVLAEEASLGDVKILTNVTGGKDDDEMVLFQEALGVAIGANVTMEKPASNYDDVMMQKLGAGEQYDLIYVSVRQLYDLQADGAVLDLTDLIAASDVLSDTNVIPADEWEQVTIDGKIWAGFNKTEVHKLPAINKAVADKAGLDVDAIEPTLDGYYDAFKALQEVGGEGFYALSTHIKGLHDLQPWFSSVGIKTGQVADADGNITVPMATEDAIPVWEWLAKLYAEGLLDPDCLTNETGDMRNKMMAGQTGVVVDWAAWVGLYNVRSGDNYPDVVNAYPLPGTKAEGGDYMLSRGDPSIWVIPVNAANPEGGFKALEYFATQEGGELLSIGIEGHDWNLEGDAVVMTEVGVSHGNDHGAPVPVDRQYVSPVAWNPGFEEAMQYLPYASIELANGNVQKYKDTVAKYATQIINGTMSAADGVAAMDAELRDTGVIN